MCSTNNGAVGARMRHQGVPLIYKYGLTSYYYGGQASDDTGVNAIELLCDRPQGRAGFLGETIRSDEGNHGSWHGWRICRPGHFITGIMVVTNVSWPLSLNLNSNT